MRIRNASRVEDDPIVIGKDRPSIPSPPALARDGNEGAVTGSFRLPEGRPLVLSVLDVPVDSGFHCFELV